MSLRGVRGLRLPCRPPRPGRPGRRSGEALGRSYEQLAARLGETAEIRVVGDGTDLTLGVEGRTWIPCVGRENFPDGEVFTGPVETKVDGVVRFSYPASYAGRRIRGVELEFRGGEVVARRAQQRDRRSCARCSPSTRAPGSVGEFSFGLNEAVREFTGHTLFDEKIGGTVHLALGASYPESGGQVQSALHWDMVCDLRSGSEVVRRRRARLPRRPLRRRPPLIALLGDTHMPRSARALPERRLAVLEASSLVPSGASSRRRGVRIGLVGWFQDCAVVALRAHADGGIDAGRSAGVVSPGSPTERRRGPSHSLAVICGGVPEVVVLG